MWWVQGGDEADKLGGDITRHISTWAGMEMKSLLSGR